MTHHWSYLALVACFLINVLEIGTFKSFGVFLFPIEDELSVISTSLGICMACSQALAYALSPFINGVATSVGESLIIGLGGVLVSVGVVASSFVNNVGCLGLYLSLAGVGYGMAFTPTILVIDRHFRDSNTNTAMGIMFTGGAVGMVLVPPVAEYLIEIYGWRGAMLILGASNANILVCAAVIHSNKTNYNILNLLNEESLNDSEVQRKCETFSYYLYKLRDECLKLFQSLKVPLFIPILITGLVSGITFCAWAIFLVPHAILKGLPNRQAVFLSSMGGIGAIFGRICPGPILDKGIVTGLQFALITSIANALAFFADPISNAFWTLSALALINGFAIGSYANVLLAVCKEVLGYNEAVNGYALVSMTYAAGQLAGGLTMGYILDVGIKSVGGFMILGGFATVGALMFAVPGLTTSICGTESYGQRSK